MMNSQLAPRAATTSQHIARGIFLALAGLLIASGGAPAQTPPAITFNQSFEDASLGKIEKQDDTTFRCSVAGQYDERGRNRQTTWYYFRMDHVQGRDLKLTLTDVVGEYNDKPGACPMSPDIVPVFSYDGEHWQHFSSIDWDDQKKESTLRFHPEKDTIWIAHIPPYPHSRLLRLMDELNHKASARVEVIGRTVLGRDLHLVTVTDFDKPDAGKKVVWLQARQHAWEAGTSMVMEGALRFITSDDPRAQELRARVIFKFTPMLDPDGTATGKVRFNANGYDVNRHWDEVDLRNKDVLARMPEIWYVKKTIYGWLDAGNKIDLMLNLHNTESTEYMDTQCDDESLQKRFQHLFDTLVASTTFDPSRKIGIRNVPANDTNCLWRERKVPVLLMEQRIGMSKKMGHRPTAEDRATFGKQLITVMAETVLGN